MMVASTIVPSFMRRLCSSKCCPISARSHPSTPALQRIPELEQRRRIRHRLARYSTPPQQSCTSSGCRRSCPPAPRRSVHTTGIKVDSQHPLDPNGRSSSLTLGGRRIDQTHQSRPRHHGLHLSEKPLPLCHLLLSCILALRKTQLDLYSSPLPSSHLLEGL